MTATATLDFAPIPANTMLTFEVGSDVKVYEITLEPDSLIEEIEHFEVSIAMGGGTFAADGSIDTALDTAKVLILDKSCKLALHF